MLEKLLNNGVRLDLFQIKSLSELDTNRRIQSEVQVIDFDYVKEQIVKGLNSEGLGFNMWKSCDAIKIIPQKNKLDFLELKGIEIFCERNQTLEEEIQERIIDGQIEKFDLPKKIKHSTDILNIVLQITNIGLTEKCKETYSDSVDKDYIVVLDSELEHDGIHSLEAMLDFLAETSNIRKKFIAKLEDSLKEINVLVNKPMLKYQSELTDYYADCMSQ